MRYLIIFIICLAAFAFVPAELPQVGKASFYANKFHNRKTACGERYCKDSLTAAHRSLPFGTYVKVINLSNDKEVIVRINDRGPYSHSRVIDLSYAAARELDMIRAGIAQVRIEPVEDDEIPEPELENDAVSEAVGPVPADEISGDNFTIINELAQEGFSVQAGAYKKPENLNKALEELKTAGFENITILQDVTYSRIILGPFSRLEDAVKTMADLKKQDIDCFLLK